ncbi:DUF1349 domain-containing protein [Haloarcula nitratireducens]|uniref:DUF1349 domain-containing protein n=1 Tax=Haloarcula nitratireducens TaxID=2487749 RepID=A0AAW4PIH8_9EURY|nr:DUF1349 domain-containing protein [Halomicroarcula nitratireducens]MBX0297012.1 DUF1349 domain-containing protein [Halomicroarcula nitratireducens]
MTLDSLYTDGLRDTSITVSLPEWNRIQTTASIWNRDRDPADVDLTLTVDGEAVASETVSVQSDKIRTAVEEWRRMERVEITLEHTVETAGEHTVEIGGTSQTVLTLKPLPDGYRTWNGRGFQGDDGEFGLGANDNPIIIAGTGTDAWRGVNNFNTIYRPNGLEDGGSVTVQVVSQEQTSPFTKGGLVVRNDMDAPASEDGGKGMVRALVSPPETIDRLGTSPGDEAYGRFSVEWDQNGDGTASGAPFPPTYYGDTTQESTWLRLEKDGASYTASYSIDGDTFTEMTTVEVPQAASVQDVGMWAVSLAGERCRTEFDDFTVRNP